jgi:hypothetical protein
MRGIQRNYTTVFDNTVLGFITFGPSHRLSVTLSTYRNDKNQLNWHGDIRLQAYSVKSNKYFASKKGFIIHTEELLTLYNCLNQLPKTAEIPGEYFRVLVIPRNTVRELHVGVVNYKDRIWLDVREYAIKSFDGYVGPLVSGIRIAYENHDALNTLLYKLYLEMLELRKKHGTDDKGNPLAPTEVDKTV